MFADRDTQRAIDEEIEQHMVIVHSLRTQRNAYSPVNKLPDELLSEIFMTANAEAQVITHTLLSISHICTRWRNVSLTTPQLWAAISLGGPSPESLLDLLQRSKQSPLIVSIPLRCSLDEDILEQRAPIVVPETPRFKDFSMTCYDDYLDTLHSLFLRASFALPTPLLQQLKMEVKFEDKTRSLHLLESFWTELSSLRSLELSGILPPTAPYTPMLTRLHINTGNKMSGLSARWLLDLLRNTPKVEDAIIQTVSSALLIPVTCDVPISLPNLRSLLLRLQYLRDSRIFSHLDIPTSLFGHIDFDNYNPPIVTEADLSPLKAFISSRIPLNTTSLHVINRHSYDRQKLEVRDAETQSILLNLRIDHLPRTIRQPATFLRPLPLENIHQLTLSGSTQDALIWWDFLPLFKNLRRIRAHRVVVVHSMARHRRHSSISKSLSFKLYNLKLVEIYIFDDQDSSPNDWAHFIHICRARHQIGNPIRQVKLLDCQIPRSYVQHLKVWTELDWDGRGEVLNGPVEAFEELSVDGEASEWLAAN